MIAAIVVLFHPKIEQLWPLFSGVRLQVDAVWFIDNTPGAAGTAFAPLAGQPAWDLNYIALGDNLGIALAQNIGIKDARSQGYDHILLLDQDSLIPAGTIEKLVSAERSLLSRGVNVAAVGPVFVDEKTKLPGKAHHHKWFRLDKPFVDLHAEEPIETDWLIASGSLIRADAFDSVGLMREELFIDTVDMEWGMRARSMGLRSFVVPTAQIEHSIGDSFVIFMGVPVIVHGDVRNYYIARNWIYLLHLPTMGAQWRSGALLHTAKFLAVHTWIANERLRRARLFTRALIDGLNKRMGRFQT